MGVDRRLIPLPAPHDSEGGVAESMAASILN